MKSTCIQHSMRGFMSAIAILAAVLFFNSVMYAQTPDFSLSKKVSSMEQEKGDLLSQKVLQKNLFDAMSPTRFGNSGENLKPTNIGDAKNVELVGRWANGPCQAVAVVGNTAYFGNGGYLEIVDFSDPANPIELGKVVVPGPVEGVVVNGGYAYVADYMDGLRVINVSNTTHPFEIGYFDTGDIAYDVAVSGGYAYVADDDDGLRVIDVSDPSHPFEAGYFDTDSYAYSVALSGSYAYVADGYDGLRVIDVSDPTHPFEVGYFDTGGTARGVAVSGGFTYVADGSDGLRVIDVSNPTNPFEVGYFDTGGHTYDVAVSRGYAYVADAYKGLRVINVSDPTHPFEAGYFDTSGNALDVAVSGDYVYVADDYKGFLVIDVSDPTNPFEVYDFYTGDCAYSVAKCEGYTYVAYRLAGLWVIDVSNLTNPFEIGYFDTGGSAWDVAVSGNYAYVADSEDGLRVIDISDPTNPFEAGYFVTHSDACGIAVNGGYAYVADRIAGLGVIDVSDPTHPFEVGYYNTVGYALDVVVSGDYAYVADYMDGLRVIDVSNPTNPFEVGYFNTNGYSWGVAVSGGYAYVADGRDGLRVIDVSDPANPLETGYFDTGGGALGVAVSGGYAYVADDWNGLRVIDVSDPTNPFEAGYFDTGDNAHGVAVSGGFAYVADGRNGLYILRYLETALWEIIGSVSYYSNDEPIDSALVKANIIYSDTTDLNGDYKLRNLPPDNYVVRPEKENDINNAISAFDAAWILQYGVELRTFTPYQMIAGDVSGNGTVSAFDADKILQYGVGLIDQFPVMADSTHFWRFVPEDFPITLFNWTIAPDSIAYTPLNSDTTDNYYGIIYGDVTGNWHPSGSALASLGKSSDETVDIRLKDIHGEAGEKVVLPVIVENGSDILAISFSLEYDPKVLKALSASTTEETEGWQIAYNIKGDLIKIALAGSKPITNTGAVANFEFEVLKTELLEANSPLNISDVMINEGKVSVSVQSTKFTTGAPLPKEYALFQNYPNPFNPETMIRYQLPKPGKVAMKIYNTLGQEIRTLVDNEIKAGYHEIRWDGRDDRGVLVSSGVYIYRIQAAEFDSARKMLFLR